MTSAASAEHGGGDASGTTMGGTAPTRNVLDYGDVSVPAEAYATLADGAWLADPIIALYCQYGPVACGVVVAAAEA